MPRRKGLFFIRAAPLVRPLVKKLRAKPEPAAKPRVKVVLTAGHSTPHIEAAEPNGPAPNFYAKRGRDVVCVCVAVFL